MTEREAGGGFRLTERDARLLCDVALSNALGMNDLVRLGYFDGVSRARRRSAALVADGLLRRTFVADGSPAARSVFAIAPGAIDLVSFRTGLDRAEVARQARRPLGRTFLEHSAFVTSVRIALAGPASSQAFEFAHEPLARHEYAVRREGRTRLHVFKPDGLLRLPSPKGLTVAFLEADRGNVSQGKWRSKVLSYRRYVRLGLFAGEYGDARPVVLAVTESGPGRVRRLANAADVPVVLGGQDEVGGVVEEDDAVGGEDAGLDGHDVGEDGGDVGDVGGAHAGPACPAFYFADRAAVEKGGASGRAWSRRPGSPPVSLLEIAARGRAC